MHRRYDVTAPARANRVGSSGFRMQGRVYRPSYASGADRVWLALASGLSRSSQAMPQYK